LHFADSGAAGTVAAVLAQTTTHMSLLARLSDGRDQAAWADFCDRYEELVRSFARRQGVAPADQDDVLQDVMLALTKAMPGFEYQPSKGKFRSYLKTVTLHAIYRRSCQNPRVTPLEGVSTSGTLPSAEDAAEELWEAEWRQYHMRTAMRIIRAEFGAADLAAFEAYVGAGRGAEQTAAELGISVDRVYQAKSRILRRLGEVIAAQVAEEG
jgi:RNA polymerase sigma-70 factor, ECF subfamily